MSGIIGHVTYAVLGAQAATARRLPVAPLLRRHWASYLCTGLHYAEMVALADKANFRHALWQIGEAVAEVFADVVQLQPTLQDLPGDAPPWDELTRHWRRMEQP